MLKSIKLRNYRGFTDHRVNFSKFSILVGKNNAGKSTVIEALRILSICQRKASNGQYVFPPEWLKASESGVGFSFRIDSFDIDIPTVHRNYEIDEISYICGHFTNGVKIEVFIGKDEFEVFCKISVGKNIVNSRTIAKKTNLGKIRVMPPIGQLISPERPVQSGYMRQHEDGRISYRHFRNQLNSSPQEFKEFCLKIEETWHGVVITSLELNNDGEFMLMIMEGPHPCEAYMVGSGLQAWLQTVWFISRVDRDSIIVLDEPDVYLHSDVQRRLVKLIGNGEYRQVVVATHSTDIISDVPPNYIVVVNKRSSISRALSDSPSVQAVLSDLGSMHNIQLSKLGQSGAVLFVEGNDVSFLSDVASKLGSNILHRFTSIPTFPLGGKSNWLQSIGAAEAFHVTSNGGLRTFTLLDGDFLSDQEKEKMKSRAEKSNLYLHIWNRYEIENYFICAKTISNYINQSSESSCSYSDILKLIDECALELKKDTLLKLTDHIGRREKQSAASTNYKLAEAQIEGALSAGYSLDQIVSGKSLFSLLSKKCQEKYGIGFGPQSISKRMSLSDMPLELLNFVNSLV